MQEIKKKFRKWRKVGEDVRITILSSDSPRLCLNPGFGKKKRKGNEKVRVSTRPESLDAQTFLYSFPFSFPSLNSGFKHNLNDFASIYQILCIVTNLILLQSFGSQQWDTGFAVQAVLACNLLEESRETLRKGHDFIKKSQVFF